MTYVRVSTEDTEGCIAGYIGHGAFTDDPMETFGGYGVMKIDNLQALMAYICKMGFEHHVAVNMSETADAITDALGTYLGWDVYRHV